MECPDCKKDTPRLVFSMKGWSCSDCYKPPFRSHDAMLHRVRNSRFTKFTEADAQRIKTNAKRSDGQYRPDPRWRTAGD